MSRGVWQARRMSDHLPTVVVVSGRPGSGKTTLARSIGDRLHLPVVGRDVIKTGMHATSDIDQPSDTRRFSEASYQATYDVVQLLLSRGVSLIVEAAFHAEFADAPLRALAANSHVVHLRTNAATDVSVDRYIRRHLSGERHAAHGDDEFIERATSDTMDWSIYELDLSVRSLDIDTNHGLVPDLDQICDFIRKR